MSESAVASFEDKHIAWQAFKDRISVLEDLPPIEKIYRLAQREGLADYLTAVQKNTFLGLCSNETLRIYGRITRKVLDHNGLRKRKYPCSLPDIARLSASPAQWETFISPPAWEIGRGILDHLTGAEDQEGRAAVLISHTQNAEIDTDDLRQTLKRHGIELTLPGNGEWGSWYSPGSTLPLVFHHPSIEFRFPSWIEETGSLSSQNVQTFPDAA